MASSERAEGCTRCVRQPPNEPQLCLGDHTFTYDHVFSAGVTQSAVYAGAVEPLVERCVDGFNATVFAYGQTGSGKTYTMGGAPSGQDVGVIPRAAKSIFAKIATRSKESPNIDFSVSVSYLELYREDVRDLLKPGTAQESLPMRENARGEVFVAGLHREAVTCAQDVLRLLERGSMCRSVGATLMNATSSRSHAVFSIFIDQHARAVAEAGAKDDGTAAAAAAGDDGDGDGDGGAPLYKTARFNLVDLAGSERAKRTAASGERLAEGISINRGLLALGNVISALGDAKKRRAGAHVPYRTSKLTRLLQDSLGGNSHTLMLACVSPADSNFQETLTTLRYAHRARNIKNKPKANVDEGAAALGALQRQVQALQVLLVNERKRNRANGGGNGQRGARAGAGASAGERAQTLQLIDELNSATTQLRAVTEQRDRWRLRCENFAAQRSAAEDGESGGSVVLDAMAEEQQMGVVKAHLQRIAALEHEVQQLRQSGASVSTSAAARSSDASDASESGVAHKRSEASPSGARQAVIVELSSEMSHKEVLLSRVQAGAAELDVLRTRFRSQMSDMEREVRTLQDERASLLNRLHGGDASASALGGGSGKTKGRSGVSAERATLLKKQLRERAAVLKAKEQQLASKRKEISQLAKMKATAEKKASTLRNEMGELKKQKEAAAKQLKESRTKWLQQKGSMKKQIAKAGKENTAKSRKMHELERQQARQAQALRKKAVESTQLRQQHKVMQSKLERARKLEKSKGVGGRYGGGRGGAGGAGRAQQRAQQRRAAPVEKVLRGVVRAIRASTVAQEKVEACKQQRMEKSVRRKQINSMLAAGSLSAAGAAALKSELNELVREVGGCTAEIGVLCRESAAAEDESSRGLRKMASVSDIKRAHELLAHLLTMHMKSTERCRAAEVQRKTAQTARFTLETALQRQENIARRKVEAIESAYEEKVLYLLKQLSASQLNAGESGTLSIAAPASCERIEAGAARTPRFPPVTSSTPRTAFKSVVDDAAAPSRTSLSMRTAVKAARPTAPLTPVLRGAGISAHVTPVQRGTGVASSAPAAPSTVVRTIVKPKLSAPVEEEEAEAEYEEDEEEFDEYESEEEEEDDFSETEESDWTPEMDQLQSVRTVKSNSAALAPPAAGGAMTYREMQKACKSLGLCAVGKKVDLQRRLEEHREAVALADPEAADKASVLPPPAIAAVRPAAKAVRSVEAVSSAPAARPAPRAALGALGRSNSNANGNSLLGLSAPKAKGKGAKPMAKHASMPAAQKLAAKPRRKRDLFSERKFGGLAARVNSGVSTSKSRFAVGDKENAVRRFAR